MKTAVAAREMDGHAHSTVKRAIVVFHRWNHAHLVEWSMGRRIGGKKLIFRAGTARRRGVAPLQATFDKHINIRKIRRISLPYGSAGWASTARSVFSLEPAAFYFPPGKSLI
ncbi:protein of unknown function [Burkholderia multivorans]